MRRFSKLIFASLLASCAAEPLDDADYLDDVEMARIDGSVEDDGIFYDARHQEAYCTERPDSRWCSDIGSTEQPWVSAEYHGRDSGGGSVPCYSSSSTNSDCRFPALKQMKIQFDTSHCFDNAPAGFTKPPVAAVDKMILAFKAGALAWNGVANGVTVEDGTCAWPSGCTTITMSCEDIPSSGEANLTAPWQTRITNLPVGPHGEDQVKALVSLTGYIKFNVFRVWSRITATCGQTGTETEIVRMARQVGRHEMGHTFGFSHFNGEAQVMFPNTNCFVESAVNAEFKDALNIFNSAGGSATISDVNLELRIPN